MTDDNKAIDPGLYLWLSGAPEEEVRKVMSAELFEELSAPLTPEQQASVASAIDEIEAQHTDTRIKAQGMTAAQARAELEALKRGPVLKE